MRKILLAALGIVFIIALTGCVRMDLNVEVGEDGKGHFSGNVAYNASYFSEDQISNPGDSRTIKHYDYDGQDWIGYDLDSKEYDSYDEFAKALTEIEGSGSSGSGSGVFQSASIRKEDGPAGAVYVFEAQTTPISSGDSSSSMGSMSDYVKFNINIKMPGKVNEDSLENATLNPDGTVTINYNPDKVTNVYIESGASGNLGINIEFNSDGSAAYTCAVIFDASETDEDDIELPDGEAKIRHYEFGGKDWIGYDLGTEEYDSFDELADDLIITDGGSSDRNPKIFESLSVDKDSGLWGSTYTLKAETSGSNSVKYQGSNFGYFINIKMPGKLNAESIKNASVNDDGSVTVDLSTGDSVKVSLESKTSGFLGIILIAIACVVVIAVVVIVIVVIKNKKKVSGTAMPTDLQ